MEVDFLLVGQGLAGTVLSHQLITGGYTVHLIDMPAENKSSRVAAGLYNPITGKKMVKTWNADQLFPVIEPFYEGLEKLLGVQFLHKRPIYRPFLNVEELNEWMGFSGDKGFEPYIEKIVDRPLFEEVQNDFGGVLLKNSGFLDLNTLLDTYSKWLLQKNMLSEKKFEERNLNFERGYVAYGDIRAKSLIYANGLGAMKSGFFDGLPFAPVKGEILTIEQSFTPYEIINRGVFRISLPDGNVKVGSTYSWHDLEKGISEKAKMEILEKHHKLIKNKDYKLIQHEFGIRPATKDRKPFLGKHPKHENVYLFNGFGAKGVSLAPYYSKVMTELLTNDKEPPLDVNVKRFFSYI
ncbi:NAD(P)/FAD-dependent oxidoreductase [Pararhodonellum marinum]|uniref:NAD(P)/FAD-dependent oxidoreductase n=1 Tax=Pararhodonellum marinum TaxID=2755358 RepID=UPI00188F1B1C|nr:FAD-dependent oxidoreductase [Pararhodonellum marinum]